MKNSYFTALLFSLLSFAVFSNPEVNDTTISDSILSQTQLADSYEEKITSDICARFWKSGVIDTEIKEQKR